MLVTELSAETRAVADLLAATPVDAGVTMAELSQAIGRDITKCRHVIAAARRVAMRESGAVFSSERGVGYRRLSPDRASLVLGPGARKHIRRTARHAQRGLIAATSRSNDLPPETQRRISAEISVLGLVEHLSRDKVMVPADDASLKPMPVAVAAKEFFSRIVGA